MFNDIKKINYRISHIIGPLRKIGCEPKKSNGGPIILGISNLSLQITISNIITR